MNAEDLTTEMLETGPESLTPDERLFLKVELTRRLNSAEIERKFYTAELEDARHLLAVLNEAID